MECVNMQVLNVQNDNYQPNFAMKFNRKNPRIPKEVRALVAKADLFLEKDVEQKTSDGVSFNLAHRLYKEGVKFCKEIEGKQAELKVTRFFGPDSGTEAVLTLTEPGSNKRSVFWYNSDGFKTDLENIDAYYRRISDDEIIGPIKGYRAYAQRCATFKKYAEILLQDI